MYDEIRQKAIELKRATTEDSVMLFAKNYLGHHIKLTPSKAHLEIYGLLKDILMRRGRKVAVAAFRNFGKSTQVTLIYILYCICYSKEEFIVIISNTASQAKQILDNVKSELTQNKALQEAFPEVFEAEGRPKPPRWTEEEIITRTGIRILALGSGQQIRGRRHGTHRPTLVIADDLEDSDNTISYDSREKMKRWFDKAVLGAGSETTNYCILGNLFHPYSLLGEYFDKELRPGWESFMYKAIETWPKNMHLWEVWARVLRGQEQHNGATGKDAAYAFYQANTPFMDEGTVLQWPEKWSLHELMLMRENNKFAFDAEMQNEPIDPSTVAFDMENIHYLEDSFGSVDNLVNSSGKDIEYYGALDPSMGKSAERGDYSAIIILARHKKTGVVYIVVADVAHRPVGKQILDVLSYAQRYNPVKFAIEVNNFQDLLRRDIEDESSKAGIYLNVHSVNNVSDKIARIQCLYTHVKNGTIQFSRNHKLLLDECRTFPKGQHDDALDALEMAFGCIRGNVKKEWSTEDMVEVMRGIVEDAKARDFRQNNWMRNWIKL